MAHWSCPPCSNDNVSSLSLRVNRFTPGSSFLEHRTCGSRRAFWRYAFSPYTNLVSRKLAGEVSCHGVKPNKAFKRRKIEQA